MEFPTLDKFPKQVLAQIDIQTAFFVSRLVVAAERLEVFRVLHGRRLTAAAIGRATKIHPRYLGPFLNSLVSLGLLRKTDETYRNTPFGEKYFVSRRSIHWTRQFSAECVRDFEALGILEQILTSGRRYETIKRLKKPNYLESMTRNRHEAEDFTQMLFHLHQGEAEALANYLKLSKRRAVLDVGGGSGIMSIALATRNPELRASILDIDPVCKIAARNVRRAGLTARVRTITGDIRQPLPAGYDFVMFCDVGELPPSLLRNAYKSLPNNGLLVLADRYLSDDGTRPLDRLVSHFTGSSFGLATRRDMVEAVKSCGFQNVKARNVYRDVWFITAIKRARRRLQTRRAPPTIEG